MLDRPTMLCVDDEPTVLEVLAKMFERQCTVLTATSGADALALLKKHAVDLVVTDQKMPGMTGVELIRQAREAGSDVVAVLLTAYTNPTDIIAAINQGQIYRFVTKPWDVNDLAMTVKNGLELAALRKEKERMLATMRKRLEALSVMSEVSRYSTHESKLEGLVDRLLSTVQRVLPHDASAALIDSGEGLTPSIRIRCNGNLSEAGLFHVKDSLLAAHKRASPHPIHEDKIITNVSGAGVVGREGHSTFPGSLTVQLVSNKVVVGTLSLFSSKADAYSADDGELLDLLVNQTTDALTYVRATESDARVRIEKMIEAMNDGVILLDDRGSVVVLNTAARTFLQLSTQDEVSLEKLQTALGISPFDIVRGWEYGGQRRFREEIRLFDNSYQLVVAPVSDATRSLKGVLLVLHDESEHVLLQQRKDEFVSIVSHELRTPLTSITGALDLVLNNLAGEVNVKQRRFLDMARDSTEKLNAIVDDLLDLSKFERGRMRMSFEFAHVDELVRRCVEKYQPATLDKDARIELEVRAVSPLRALIDSNRMTQVLNNLLTNAVKFTRKGGSIRVSVGEPIGAPGFVAISVWNSGEPIPEGSHERIFNRFEQARTGTNRAVPGTGLGLSICRSIVLAHGGRVWSEPDPTGARFVVVLPIEPPTSHGEEAPATEKSAPIRGTVLIVEDHPELAWMLKAVLLENQYNAVVAHNGDDALALARRYRPDLITLDKTLPDLDGLKLLEIFRHDPDTKASQVLVLSGADCREEVLRAGANGFLMKPVGAEAFIASIHGLMSSRTHMRGRVLVIDDEPRIVAICSEILANHGFEVARAASIADARRQIETQLPDMMLLDVALPDGDGMTFFEELKAERASSPMPVVFISARTDTSAKVRALRLGGDDYITKPFDALELAARVESIFRRRSAEALSSPTTQLPGSAAIEREVRRRVAEKKPFVFCYLDLDNLKAFNDYYGFAKADGVVRQTADLLREAFGTPEHHGDFVGHVAGDDFVFLTEPHMVDQVCLRIIESFDRIIPLYYDKKDRERGSIEAEDRFGQRRLFPIMSISIVAVMSDGSIEHPELAKIAAELKKKAKAIQGSVYLRSDREAPVSKQAE